MMEHAIPQPKQESEYHRVLDAEMKWLWTLLHDAGVRTDLQRKLSQCSEAEVTLWLYVTQEPCDFCTQMLLLHHPELKNLYAIKPNQTLKIVVVAQASYRKSSCKGFEQLTEADRQVLDIIPYWQDAQNLLVSC